MTLQLAFIGDVHGEVHALRGLWGALPHERIRHSIFLGDYVNKGRWSAKVLDFLIQIRRDNALTLLRGNHEAAMLSALKDAKLAPFLKMGGAMTIRSYIRGPAQPEVLRQFASSVPASHVELLESMCDEYEGPGVVARHVPWKVAPKEFAVTAHRLAGPVPRVLPNEARIDTGCGDPSGRLTALLWPSLDYIQVGGDGESIGVASVQ